MVPDPEKFKDEEEILSGDLSAEDGVVEEELADLTQETGDAADGEGVPGEAVLEMDEAAEGGEEPPAEVRLSREEIAADEAEGVMVKYCLFCRETILAEATACKFCGHVVHVFEGAVFKQLWWFFWAGVIAFIGALLPFNLTGGSEGMVSAYETFPGAFYLLFSVFLVFAMSFNIYSRRLIMGPVFLMFIPAIHCWWLVVDAVGGIEGFDWYMFFFKVSALNELTAQVGSGMMLLLLGSTIASLTFIMSLFSAVTGGGKKKPAKAKGSKPAKGAGRGRRGRGKS
jgi:hypothetical protein